MGPRDGLQNESVILSTQEKLRYINMLSETGLKDIEVSSFVNPARVPQLSDASEIFQQLERAEGIRYSALVPNMRGLERAQSVGVDAIAVFTAASETFTQNNIGVSIDQSLTNFEEVVRVAVANRIWVRGYVSTAFFCPFEGRIKMEQVTRVVERLLEMGVDEISVGDTIGHAVPTDVSTLTEVLLATIPLKMFAYHFHDTRGTALANVLRALEYGISIFDSASGGSGGCPFAPGASGNLATEDLLYMLQCMGIETGVKIDKSVDAALYLEAVLGRYLPGKYMQASDTVPEGLFDA